MIKPWHLIVMLAVVLVLCYITAHQFALLVETACAHGSTMELCKWREY